ncbi:MAG TPA: SEC-C domain-containing protein [Longimicrobium sp.]|nr:SEC-C domain-containing protein [Longimicrobium sp.]
MKTSRNDPCPCGSGKKYKACCMGRDQARAHARSLLGAEAFDEAEGKMMEWMREAKVWSADIAPAIGSVREHPDAALTVVMVCAGEFVAHADVIPRRPAGLDGRAQDVAAAVETAIRIVGATPERLEVPHQDLARALGPRLAGRGIEVACAASKDLLDAMHATLAHMDPSPAQGRMVITSTWCETGASAEELADLHEAAAGFYAAAPWDEMDVPETLLLEFAGEESPWAASLMGGGGESFGLVLHSSLDDLRALWTSFAPSSAFLDMDGFTLTVDFDRKGELTRTMQREIAAARWPIAAPGAYPRLFAMNLPGRWVGPGEVRRATQALRAVTQLAQGGDPLVETGVRVTPFDPEADDDDSRLDWFDAPEEAAPVRAEGPGVEPRPHLAMWESAEEFEARLAASKERVAGFAEWLREQGVPEEEAEIDIDNADAWRWWTAGPGFPGAATELDLRLFLYDIYVRKTDPTPEAVRALPRSMRRVVRWLEEREGVRYPFAAGVLDELERIAARAQAMDEPLEDTLRILSYDVYDDLDIRLMLPSSRGWPDMMSLEVAKLREELQRRWLLWYDELVRGGMTNLADLEDELLARQRAWETTPHPQVGGRTPAQVAAENAH